MQDNLVHKTFVQVFENLWSQGIPFDHRGLGVFHVHCDFSVLHGHYGFVFLMIAMVLMFFFDHCGLVFLMVIMILVFFMAIMVLCSSRSPWC